MADGARGHGALWRCAMWLATLSILGQVVYNLEISRYTLYTGEPIFTGKFRTLPGPHSGYSRIYCWISVPCFRTWPRMPPRR